MSIYFYIMGWYLKLKVSCVVLPEFYDFFKSELMRNRYTLEYNEDSESMEICDEGGNVVTHLSKSYHDLLYTWLNMELSYFQEYDFCETTGIFFCSIEKKVTKYAGNLQNDYMTFLQDILVPASSEITECRILDDNFHSANRSYTDMELRGQHFTLHSLIREFTHIHDEDGNIKATTIAYKRSIHKSKEIDLNKCILHA